jgi:hypothetical protein
MAGLEYRQALEIRDTFCATRRPLPSGAILVGYPDTTQDADVFSRVPA